jgi:hypothetical protein
MRCTILLLTAVAAFAQTAPRTISIAASRNLTLLPDQVIYQVIVRTAATASLDDALAPLAGTPLTAANLTRAGNFNSFNPLLSGVADLYWTFEWITPLSNIKGANAMLSRAMQQAEQRSGAGSFTYEASRVQISEAAARQACDSTALVNDARTEAGRIASAAGVGVGSVISISDNPAPAILAQRTGTFTGIPSFAGTGSAFFVYDPILYYQPATVCSLTVVFRLIG